MDVAVERGEDELGVGENDAADGGGEAAEAVVAGVGEEGGEVDAVGEVEETNGAVVEPGGEVVIGEGEAAANKALLVVVAVRGDKMEGCV